VTLKKIDLGHVKAMNVTLSDVELDGNDAFLQALRSGAAIRGGLSAWTRSISPDVS
jgi:hypothetical protein